MDQVTLFGVAAVPPLSVAFSAGSFGVGEGGTANATVRLSRPLGDDDPDEVTVGYTLSPGTATAERDYTPGGRNADVHARRSQRAVLPGGDPRTRNTKAARPSS